jgi:hypothetical protein
MLGQIYEEVDLFHQAPQIPKVKEKFVFVKQNTQTKKERKRIPGRGGAHVVTRNPDVLALNPLNSSAHLKKGIALERLNLLKGLLLTFFIFCLYNVNTSPHYTYDGRQEKELSD